MNLPKTSKPGEIPNEEYHYGEEYRNFISSSQLKNYLVSPKYAHYVQQHPRETQTMGMLEGTIYHDLLESKVNKTLFTWVSFDDPPINSRTGKPFGSDTIAYQSELEKFKSEHPGCKVAPVDLLENVKKMVDHLLYEDKDLSPDIMYLIKQGKAEESHFLEYEGGFFKYRTDLRTKTKIIDWKKTTLENPKVENFPSIIIKYGYHISAAMYQFFEAQVTGKWKKFFWVVQENEPPYDFMILDSSEWTWDISRGEVIPKVGALIFLKLLEQHIWCLEHDHYPGYSVFVDPDWKGHRIGTPEVPGWYQKQSTFNFYNNNGKHTTEKAD